MRKKNITEKKKKQTPELAFFVSELDDLARYVKQSKRQHPAPPDKVVLVHQEQVEDPIHHLTEIHDVHQSKARERQPLQRPSDLANQLAPRASNHDANGMAIRNALLNSGHEQVDVILPRGMSKLSVDGAEKAGVGTPERMDMGAKVKEGHLPHHDSYDINFHGQRG